MPAPCWRTRTTCLIVGFSMALASGSQYAFGGYEKDLKSRWGWHQGDVQTVGWVFNMGTYLGHLPSGWFIDSWGPRIGAGGASVLCSVGYYAAGVSAATASANASQSVLPLSASVFVVGAGSGLGYMSALKGNTCRWAPESRGKVIGLLAAGFGLSSAAVSGIYQVATWGKGEGEGLPGFFFGVGTWLAAAYLLGALATPSRPEAVMYRRTEEAAWEQPQPRDMAEYVGSDGVSKEAASKTEEEAEGGQAEEGSSPAVQVGDTEPKATPLLQAMGNLLRQRSFHALAACFFLTGGAGLLFLNNASTIAESLGSGSDSTTLGLEVTVSVGNFLGRLVCGAVSDVGPWWRNRSLSLAAALMSVAFLLATICTTAGPLFFVATFLVGTSYGSVWAAVPALLSDRWGMVDFGKHFGLSALCPAAGSLVFNSICGAWYDHHAVVEDSGDAICTGTVCYRLPFIVCAGVCVLAVGTGCFV
eukprot:TRINITY_DN6597_c0_g1_i2.p1 TRINITY_DN6597_c0_g1~~TRINITY_DN6597_c0_g1_i2.p1  ORF type:complete len:474 (+),score=93.04 TRINITY_DN6597_c0_g1_i2:64-1485(+)